MLIQSLKVCLHTTTFGAFLFWTFCLLYLLHLSCSSKLIPLSVFSVTVLSLDCCIFALIIWLFWQQPWIIGYLCCNQ